MKVTALRIPEVKLIEFEKRSDERGYFSEVYAKTAFEAAGLEFDFVQDNHSFSIARGTVRGLHFQAPPCAQAKLVRVVRGAIYDVAVDLRRASPTFGQHVFAKISADNWLQIMVPAGFAHGFCTLEPETEVLYKVTSPYEPSADMGVLWNDPALAIDWPVTPDQAILSEKDREHPRLAALGPWF